MSLDLGAIFGVAGGVAAQLVESSGTRVRISRTVEGREAGVTDPQTLVQTPAAPTVVHADVPAILSPLGAGAMSVGASDVGTATPVQIGTYVLALLPGVEDLQEQDEVTVLACADPRLVGREMDVTTLLDSSAGVLRVAHVLPRTLGPGGT